MLQKLEADIAHVQHPLLQITIAGSAELGAKMFAGRDHRLSAAQAAQQPAQQMLAQRGVGGQRAMRLKDRAGGTVVIQQAELNIFHQQGQALVQRRLFLFNCARCRQRA